MNKTYTKLIHDGEERFIYDYYVTSKLIADRHTDREFIDNIDEKSMRVHYFISPLGVPQDEKFTIRRDETNNHLVDGDYSNERVKPWGVQAQHGKKYHGPPRTKSEVVAYRVFEKTFSDEYTDSAKRVIREDYEGDDIFPDPGYSFWWTHNE